MDLKLDPAQLDRLTRALAGMPGTMKRARISALKSTGYMIQQETRDYVEGGGSGWPGLHPMTRMFKAKYSAGKRTKWIKPRSRKGPVHWLGKFARYRVDGEGSLVQVDFGKSRKGKPGTFDPGLVGIVRRVQSGERITVTDKMRRFFGATRRKRPKVQTPGETYFPLRASTTTIEIPKRPILDPVFRAAKPRIPGRFEEKFWKALDRYWSKR